MARFILLLMAALSLNACASFSRTQIEKVPCILPDDLKKKEIMEQYPQAGGDLNRALDLWAKDRADGARIAKKHSDVVDFVDQHCQ